MRLGRNRLTGYDSQVLFRAFGIGLNRLAIAGFLVSGFLFALLGSLLPAWGFDIINDYGLVGRHFLAIVSGMVLSTTLVRRIYKRSSTRGLLVSGCGLAALGLAGLAGAPGRTTWHLAGIFIIGIAAGLLHLGLFQAISIANNQSPAASINLGGISFGLGSIICTLLVAGTYWAYSVQTILLILAGLPAIFAVLYARRNYPPVALFSHPKVLKQFRSGAAILFSLLLFFQFGNEWAIAGWIPLFLIHRLGMSPASALQFLAGYFLALTLGRTMVYYLLTRVKQLQMLAVSAAASLLGCGVLAATNNRFGAGFAIALIGFGFAAIYPLVAAWIARRFPYYHPSYFNGIFSIALAGGMLAPWLLGEIAARAGVWAVMTLPAVGTCMVMVLLGLIWMEAKVTGA